MTQAANLAALGSNVTSTGNVGVGTSSPYNLLSIQGNSAGSFVAAPGLSLYDTSGNTNSRNWAFMNAAGAAGYGQLALISSSASGGTPTANTYWLLDNAGRMTVPSQVAFQVRVNSANYITTSPVPFGTAVYNTGNAWNTSTYTFTAPVAGRYMFFMQWYQRVATANAGGSMRLILNGSQISYCDWTSSSATSYLALPYMSILNLSAGDSIYYNYGANSGVTYYGGVQELNLYGYLLG
jgi:hypothetical protein